jgi:hypothetical protein
MKSRPALPGKEKTGEIAGLPVIQKGPYFGRVKITLPACGLLHLQPVHRPVRLPFSSA